MGSLSTAIRDLCLVLNWSKYLSQIRYLETSEQVVRKETTFKEECWKVTESILLMRITYHP